MNFRKNQKSEKGSSKKRFCKFEKTKNMFKNRQTKLLSLILKGIK